MIYEKAEILTEMSVAAVWQLVAASQRQFVLIGDAHHREHGIIEAAAEAMPGLAAAGVRHLGLEREFSLSGRLYETLRQNGDRATQNAELRAHLSMWRTAHLPTDDPRQQDHIRANFNLITSARDNDMGIYALNHRHDFRKFAAEHGAADPDRFFKARLEHFRDERVPVWLADDERQLYKRIDGLYADHNLEHDRDRAAMLLTMARDERAAMLCGSRHFRRLGGGSISDYLPARSQAYVMLGSAAALHERFTGVSSHINGLPDFAIETDTKRGYVLPPAMRNGLI